MLPCILIRQSKGIGNSFAQASITGGAGRSMEYIEPNFHLNCFCISYDSNTIALLTNMLVGLFLFT